MSQVFLRTMYNYDVDAASNESALGDFEHTLTVQSEAENCDINVILQRFGQGVPPPIVNHPPLQYEWNDVTSFHDAMNVITSAREAFMEVPANIRARFHNSPQEYLDFIYNDDNRDEAISLGLIPKPVPAESAPSGASSVGTGSTSDSASEA